MSYQNRVLVATICIFSLLWIQDLGMAASQGYLSADEYALLDEMLNVHVNFFLSSEVITTFGLPLTAYKVGDRARYGYSNPTEWGYALQAWIAAATRGIIPPTEAINRISTALNTMQALQQDPDQNYQGLFYPYYKMTDPSGNDLPAPYHDPNPEIPSGDNALLYASLLIIEGWAKGIGNFSLESQARSIRNNMNFRIFLFSQGGDLYLAHTKNANSGQLSASKWDIYADEGGVVTWIAYLSGSVTFEEYKALTESQMRQPASWTSCIGESHTVQEAAWFNSMFTWSVRSLAGFPISDFDAPGGARSLYSLNSFVPNVRAHLAYGDCLGVDYPAFSDAMTQSEGGQGLASYRCTPPNLAGEAPDYPPDHAMPHAFFVPFNAGPDLPSPVRTRLVTEITELKDDLAGYYHDSGPYPFGFEVVVSPYKNDLDYNGADEGRNIFETLSEAYIVLSLFNALQLDDGGPTFYTLAAYVSGYTDKVRQVLQYLYPSTLAVHDIDPSWCGQKIAFASDRDGNWEIYTMNSDFTNQTRLTYNSADDLAPAWSPDCQKIAFVSNRDGDYKIYIMNADGTNQNPVTDNVSLCDSDLPNLPTWSSPTWSPDGNWVAFAGEEGHVSGDPCRGNIYRVHPDGTGKERKTSDPWGNSNDIEPDWSPLGNEVVYSSNRTGLYCIKRMDADAGQGPGSGDSIICPEYPGYPNRYGQAAWSPDGRYIAFVDMCLGNIHIIKPDGTGDVVLTNGYNPDWSPDGQRIVYDTGSEIRVIPLSLPSLAVFRVTKEGAVYADGAFYGSDFVSGSADVAEWVPVSEPVEPGDVLELDPENPGYFRKARGSCSHLVAGVVSTEPGVVLGHSEETEGKALLALMGVVPVKVTDEGGPIRPGDLLVASSTPGYAMRWDPEEATPCTFIGKALEPWEAGTGTIRVLLMR